MPNSSLPGLGVEGDALMSEDGIYRYWLTRRWAGGPEAIWIMLNPSTATADRDDPTIRRCIDFSQRWGFGSLKVLNIFAVRSPSPAVLREISDPVGPANDATIARAVHQAPLVVAAWGVHGAYLERGRAVGQLLRGCLELRCLGLTQEGHPRHPLYVHRAAELVEYPV